jgi:hypothetical protein
VSVDALVIAIVERTRRGEVGIVDNESTHISSEWTTPATTSETLSRSLHATGIFPCMATTEIIPSARRLNDVALIGSIVDPSGAYVIRRGALVAICAKGWRVPGARGVTPIRRTGGRRR